MMQDHTLATVAEESGFKKTGRTDEVTRLCAAFAAAWPRAVHSLEFGRSAEGRPMRALIACRADPRKVPVLMLQGGIHPGESIAHLNCLIGRGVAARDVDATGVAWYRRL